MGDINCFDSENRKRSSNPSSSLDCDECGERPYLAPTTEDYDVEVWCECPKNVPIVFEGNTTYDGKPDKWGRSGGRFVCYECGEIPCMITMTRGGGRHPKSEYKMTCRCDMTGFGIEIGWRSVFPDKWKNHMDPTKWPEMRDEIKEAVREHGPATREEIAEHVDLPEVGVKCLAIHMQREHDLFTDRERRYYTSEQIIDGPYDIEDSGLVEERDEETGIRSGKGNGFFSRLLGL